MGDFVRPRKGFSPRVGDHPREGDHLKNGDTLRICLATFYDMARPCIMFGMSTKPFYKLNWNRQADRQADKPRYWEACASKNICNGYHCFNECHGTSQGDYISLSQIATIILSLACPLNYYDELTITPVFATLVQPLTFCLPDH